MFQFTSNISDLPSLEYMVDFASMDSLLFKENGILWEVLLAENVKRVVKFRKKQKPGQWKDFILL